MILAFIFFVNSMTTVIDINVSETSYEAATRQIHAWAQARESRAVYATSVHGTMEAHDELAFRNILNRADLITPDGMPLVWMLRLKGIRNQQRVYGPNLMLHILEMAASGKISVGFYGGASSTLDKLLVSMKTRYPALQVDYAYSPPFRLLSQQEALQVRHEIIKSGVQILFVGLGCPRQELWIDAERGYIPAVMIGVGAAFDFHAGLKPQAPAWMQKTGLEWLFRLLTEPRRLWRRYLRHIPRFLFFAAADLLGFLK
jgi:N-acetylglucosaminyldiphosphoundecaprenol N-acetyl-beta-D-mannosaminyltransferase